MKVLCMSMLQVYLSILKLELNVIRCRLRAADRRDTFPL